MSSPGSRPKKSGFMARLQSAMVPVVPEDGAPLVRPRGVTVASVLVIVAGVLFLLIGALSVASTGSQAQAYTDTYASAAKQCQDSGVGIGTAVPTTAATPTAGPTSPIALTALPGVCRTQITASALPAAELSSYKTSLTVFSVLLIVVGLVTAAGGWFLREGRRWARRVLIAVVLVQLILAFLFQVSNTITLLATLLVVAGLSTTFVGRASAYFTGTAQRKKLH